MDLQKTINDKFSIILTVAIILLALPVIATAQQKSEVFPVDGNSSKTADEVLNLCSNHNYSGGIRVAVADINFGARTLNSVFVSEISLLNGNFDNEVGVVNSCEPNVVSKIKKLLDVRKHLGLTNDVAFSIPQNDTPEWFQIMNYLRQAHVERIIIPTMKILVSDRRNPQPIEVELENVLVTSYQSGSREELSANGRPGEQMTLNFERIRF